MNCVALSNPSILGQKGPLRRTYASLSLGIKSVRCDDRHASHLLLKTGAGVVRKTTFAFRSTQLTTASSTGVKATGLRADGRAKDARAFMDTAAASGCRLVTAISAQIVFQPCTERMKPALPATSASTCSPEPATHRCCTPRFRPCGKLL